MLMFSVLINNLFWSCSRPSEPPVEKPTFIKTFGGSFDDYANEVVETPDGGYIIVGVKYLSGDYYAKGDMCIVKTDKYGNEEWNRSYGGSDYDGANSVSITSDGGYIITGFTNSNSDDNQDMWLLKTDARGNLIWSKTFSELYKTHRGISVRQTSDGGYIVAGSMLVKTDSDGNEQWRKLDIRGNSVKQTADGGYIVTYGVSEDVALIKTDSLGNKVWERKFGFSFNEAGESVELTADGGFIIVGSSMSQYVINEAYILLIKTDQHGNAEWYKIFNEYQKNYGYSIKQTKDEGYIISGMTSSNEAGGNDVLLIKTDVSGNQTWSKLFDINSNDCSYSVIQTSDKKYVIAGQTEEYDFGSDSDILLIKTDEDGNIED